MNYIPSRPESEIDKEFTDVWDELYNPSNFLTRSYNYYLTMRPTRDAIAKKQGIVVPKSVQEPQSLRRILLDLIHVIRLAWKRGIVSSVRCNSGDN